uniref:uncharacterized protein LOC124048303 n=1 Tax=Oncorhynchus gorbuscha TaxID=8017 RepID=UPI001EAF2F6B|nr:uncharacterized protein LOC124048303 [Oncorhynchus gorbuscha]
MREGGGRDKPAEGAETKLADGGSEVCSAACGPCAQQITAECRAHGRCLQPWALCCTAVGVWSSKERRKEPRPWRQTTTKTCPSEPEIVKMTWWRHPSPGVRAVLSVPSHSHQGDSQQHCAVSRPADLQLPLDISYPRSSICLQNGLNDHMRMTTMMKAMQFHQRGSFIYICSPVPLSTPPHMTDSLYLRVGQLLSRQCRSCVIISSYIWLLGL